MPEAGLLAAPEGNFAAEIARIAVGVHTPVQAVLAKQTTAELEVRELRRALAERGVPAARAAEIEREFTECRKALDTWVEAGVERPRPYGEPRERPARPALVLPPLPAGLPAEFAAYFEGAVAWHRGDWVAARARWSEVLALPREQRRHRSVWAAFMSGRAWAKEAERGYTDTPKNVAEARHCFALARELAESFPDPLGLAAESLGWEARVLLHTGNPAEAIELYLEQHVAGDETAVNSLRVAANSAASSTPERLAGLARDEHARRVLTAYFISRWDGRWLDRPVPTDIANWAVALRVAGVRDVPDADRLAWFAYEAGAFPLAHEWVALAEDTPEARWLRAKLALRGGDLQAGERLLRTVLTAPGLAEDHRLRVAAELGRVCLARDDFAGALQAALEGGHWQDAAFVAERVMNVDELSAFVDAKPIIPPPASRTDGPSFAGCDLGEMLRHLLARRLARMGRFTAAEPYFPAEWQPAFQAYVTDAQTGFDVTRPTPERAAAFWRAAVNVREHGMELLGTELEPDWSIWGGDHDHGRSVEWRLGKGEQPPRPPSVFQPSALESQRLDKQRAPAKRFHYRYRAAELAGWAAALLPNDSDQTAEILAAAGGWLKNRDPEAAKPFYQALVIRCGNTALGRAAAEKRWFPEPPRPAGETPPREP